MMCFSETDLPTPLRPMITHVSPRFTLKLTLFSTTLSSNALFTPRNSKKYSEPFFPELAAVNPACLNSSFIDSLLPECDALLRSHQEYSYSRTTGYRYQIVSRQTRQALPSTSVS